MLYNSTMKNKPEHYVNNKRFSQAVNDYAEAVQLAEKKKTEIPIISDYIGECFMNICYRMASKHNFRDYTYKEEMINDGLENCVKAIINYDITTQTRKGPPNAFGYFSLIVHRAFLRRIAKEKRQADIREKIKGEATLDMCADVGDNFSGDSIMESVKCSHEEW